MSYLLEIGNILDEANQVDYRNMSVARETFQKLPKSRGHTHTVLTTLLYYYTKKKHMHIHTKMRTKLTHICKRIYINTGKRAHTHTRNTHVHKKTTQKNIYTCTKTHTG